MKKLDVNKKSSWNYGKFFVFPLLVFLAISSQLLYAADKNEQVLAKEVVSDAYYASLVLEKDSQGNEVFKLAESGALVSGKSLPLYHCVVCVPENSSVKLTFPDGKEEVLLGPDVYDPWLRRHRGYKNEHVEVMEGAVEWKGYITTPDGKRIPVLGPAVVLLPGGSSLDANPCFNFNLDTGELLEEPPPAVPDIDDPKQDTSTASS